MLDRMTELDIADKLWERLGNIPVDDDGNIQVQFLRFPIGTDREEIWHWFEDTFDVSVITEED